MNSVKDRTNETDLNELRLAVNLSIEYKEIGLKLSSNIDDLNYYSVYFVSVPTPIDQFKAPDLRPLIKALEMLGKVPNKAILLFMNQQFFQAVRVKSVFLN